MSLDFLPPQADPDGTPEAALASSFAAMLVELHRASGGAPADAELLRAAARAASLATSAGHACLHVDELAAVGPAPARRLRASPVVSGGEAALPLVLDDDARLYLHRYWEYERRLGERLAALDVAAAVAPAEAIAAAVERLFARTDTPPDRQREAVERALNRRLTIISGGPGTGKTTTLARLIAILGALQPQARIVLAAPTGKAAARLQEALRRLVAGNADLAAAGPRLPATAYTLHRLLGWNPGSRGFHHDADNPLACDVLIVDEASMLDVALAARVLEALPDAARLVLVGDRDQLASVEAGAVFAELARGAQGPLPDAVALLDRSYRFDGDGGIGALARAVNAGDGAAVQQQLAEAHGGALRWHSLAAAVAVEALGDQLMDGYAPFVAAVAGGAEPPVVLAALERHRVLCALRDGPRGSIRANAALSDALRERLGGGLGTRSGEIWYRGRPVMVSANDHGLRLYNGDIGVALPDRDGRLLVYFPAAEGGLRALSPQRLPPCETALATTVHKSQGSEFDSIDLLLPEQNSRVLARELLYTALTRARKTATLWGESALVAVAVAQVTRRVSGLAARIQRAAVGKR